MSMIQTGMTVTAILAAVAGYLLSMYGVYSAQESGMDEIDITYMSVPSVLNSIVVIYLLYYLLYVRGEKHSFQFKVIGLLLLVGGLLTDIYFDISDKSLRATGAATGMLYTVSTLNFIVRLFYIIQFQCTDPFARRVVRLDQQQPRPQQQPFKQQPPSAIGGKQRR